MTTQSEIVSFWRDAGAEQWFARDDAFDAEFQRRFEVDHFAAARGEYGAWMESAESALALLILLDQFPRNCFRGSAHSYATDGLARHYARRAMEAGFDQEIDSGLRLFFYLPFEHAEDMGDQHRSVELITAMGNAELIGYANAHRDVIVRFGRFPHRNHALGRINTPDEQAWLDAGGGF